jgi:hypothetical protein
VLDSWDPSKTIVVNVHSLDSKAACEILANLEPEDPGIPLTGVSTEPLHEFHTASQSL